MCPVSPAPRPLGPAPLLTLVVLAAACGSGSPREEPARGADDPAPLLMSSGDVPFSAEPDPALEAAILEAEPAYTREAVEIGGMRGRYVHARFDLDGDGTDEVFVYLLGSVFCGTGGCDLLLFRESGPGYALVDLFPISRLPVVVAPAITHGWRELVRSESGGGAPPSFVRHAFDGDRYREVERLPAEAPPPGIRVLAGPVTFDAGVPLEPRR